MENILELLFPSPTGVTYYEYLILSRCQKKLMYSFRPQQGLPIMNSKILILTPEQNFKEGFRPQQGLPIMNSQKENTKDISYMFPSPTGVTYYEFKRNE